MGTKKLTTEEKIFRYRKPIDLISKGASVEDVTRQCEISRPTFFKIVKLMQENNLPFPSKSEQLQSEKNRTAKKYEKFIELFREGRTQASVARMTGANKSTVNKAHLIFLLLEEPSILKKSEKFSEQLIDICEKIAMVRNTLEDLERLLSDLSAHCGNPSLCHKK